MEYKRVKVKFLENYDGFKQGVVYSLFEDYAKRLELVKVIEFCNCINCKHWKEDKMSEKFLVDKKIMKLKEKLEADIHKLAIKLCDSVSYDLSLVEATEYIRKEVIGIDNE